MKRGGERRCSEWRRRVRDVGLMEGGRKMGWREGKGGEGGIIDVWYSGFHSQSVRLDGAPRVCVLHSLCVSQSLLLSSEQGGSLRLQ